MAMWLHTGHTKEQLGWTLHFPHFEVDLGKITNLFKSVSFQPSHSASSISLWEPASMGQNKLSL